MIRTLNQKMYPACLLPIGVTGVTNEIAGVKRLSFLQFDLRKKEHKIGIGYSKLLYKELHGSLFGCLSAAIAKKNQPHTLMKEKSEGPELIGYILNI